MLAFAVVSTPFVLYSIHRSGYEFAHLLDIRLLCSWPAIILVGVLIATSGFHNRDTKSRAPMFLCLSATAMFIGSQFLSEYPFDYKLWIYFVAPMFAVCFLFCLPIAIYSLFQVLSKGEPAAPANARGGHR